VVIGLVEPPERWARLGHGYRVEARIVLWHGEDVLAVPLTALFRDGAGGWALFVMEEGRARRREVALGRRNGLAAEIVEGLASGDRVVVHPSDSVIEGALLIPRE
jgi:HlyD family secretion protein